GAFAWGLCVRIANPPVKFDWKAAFASPRVGPVGGAADASVPPSSTNPATAAATANNVRFFIHLLDARTPTTPSQDRLAKLQHRHFRPTGRVSAGPGEYQRARNFFGVRGHPPYLEFRAWTIPPARRVHRHIDIPAPHPPAVLRGSPQRSQAGAPERRRSGWVPPQCLVWHSA